MVYDKIVSAYKKTEQKKFPDQKIISEEITEEINRSRLKKKYRAKASQYDWRYIVDNKPELAKEIGLVKDSQPSVSKHLKTLCSEKMIIKLDDKTYVPFTLEESRKELFNTIINTIAFNRDSIYVFSSFSEIRSSGGRSKGIEFQTCSFLIDVRYDCVDKAKALFRQYIGDINCYDITEFLGKLLIMLEGKSAEVSGLRDDFMEMAKSGFNKKR